MWAIRLGLFLFLRVMKTGHDSRFKRAKADPKLFLLYWTLQGRGGTLLGVAYFLCMCHRSVGVAYSPPHADPQLEEGGSHDWVSGLCGMGRMVCGHGCRDGC